MAGVDDKVVAMSFESSKFESGVNSTVSALDKLKAALHFPDAGKGLQEIDAAANQVNLSHISSSIDSIKGKFSALSIIGISALATIANKAVTAGLSVAKSFTIQPILDGFHNYETQINAVQTIMANTGLSGSQGLGQVSGVLQNLNKYANQTVYNFSQMAQNIGTFTAAGVGLKTAAESIKGIANLAALSGSSSEQASSAMYQLSQAIAAGTVHLQDWNSVVNAGIGGQVFQKALFNTGKAMGTIVGVPVGETFEQWKKAGNSFRQSLSTTAKATTDTTSALKTAQQDAAKSIAQAEQSAADSIASGAKNVQDAQQGVTDATRQGAIDVANAMQQQTDTVKKSAQDVANALDAVRLARKQLAEAMKPPSKDELQAASDTLKTSQLDQADLADAVTLAQQEQTRATQDLADAQKKLADLQASGTATPDQIIAAQRAVEDAQQRVRDDTDAQTRALLQQRAAQRGVDQAEKDLQTTREKGTKKDKNVQSAQDALTASIQQYKDAQVKAQKDISDAEKNVANVRIQSAESQKKAGQNLADAEKTQAKTIRDAQQSIVDAHEAAAKAINAAGASLNKNAPKSWLTSGVLTATLQQFTGDMTKAQLLAKGFTSAQADQILKIGKVAQGAATHIKTMTQLSQALKEEVATAWAAVFKTIFGNITDATSLFSKVHIVAENALTKPIYALNKLLEGWAELGGRTKAIEGVKQAMKDLADVMAPIKDAFREIFPKSTAQNLYDATAAFDRLAKKLEPSQTTVDNLKRTFAGLFAVLDIGKQVLGGIFTALGIVFGTVAKGGGGFLNLTGNIGDFLVKLDDTLKKSAGFHKFFVTLGNDLAAPVKLLAALKTAIVNFVSGLPSAGLNKFLGSFSSAPHILQAAFNAISGLFQNFGPTVSNALGSTDFSGIFRVIQVGLLGGIFVLLRRFIKGFSLDLSGGLFTKAGESFESLTGALHHMQTSIKAAILLEIAAAIGIIAGSIYLLAKIPEKQLNNSMSAITIALGELLGAMKILDKIGASTGFIKIPLIAGGMIALSVAVYILASAVKSISGLNMDELTKGLEGVSVLLLQISLAAGPLSRNSAGLISAGVAMIAIGGAMKILASAVKDFGQLNWTEIVKGLASVAAILVSIGASARLFPGGMIRLGLGLVGIAEGLKIISQAITQLSGLSMSDIAKSLFAIASALAVIALAMQSMPKGMILQAAGLALIAVAIGRIAKALGSLGALSMDAIVKGLVALGGALAIMAVALDAMEASLPGSLALLAAATALRVLAPVIITLGNQSWGDLIKGLIALAAAMGVLGAAGILLAPAAPALLALGVAMLAIGGGIALVGAGIALIGVGFSAIAVSGPTAIAILLKALEGAINEIPKFIEELVQGLAQTIGMVADLAPKFVVAVGKVLDALLNIIVLESPKIAAAFGALLDAALKIIEDNIPKIIEVGVHVLLALLKGINSHIGDVIDMVGNIIVTIISTLADNLKKITHAGLKVLLSFIGGIADNIGLVTSTVGDIIVNFLGGIASSLGKIVKAGAHIIVTLLGAIGSGAKQIIAAGSSMILNIIIGIGNTERKLVSAAFTAMGKFIEAVATSALSFVDKGAQTIINFMNGVAVAIRKYEPQMIKAGWNIAWSIVQGMIDGINEVGPQIVHKIEGLIGSLPNAALKLLHIHSPSQVFHEIGANIVRGLTNGITDNFGMPLKAVKVVTSGITNSVTETAKKIPGIFVQHIEAAPAPVITPVVDLSNVEDAAPQINDILSSTPVTVASPTISNTPIGSAFAALNNPTTPVPLGGINLTQNNYSPEALSDLDIYRQTKNQISTLKSFLIGPQPTYAYGAGQSAN